MKRSLQVAREIVSQIHAEGMRPGDRYLSEAEALRRHGVSRATYREALRFLEHQGVVRPRAGPGGGPEILQPGFEDLASTIALLLQFADAPLSDVLDARIGIEAGMAEEVARNASDAELAALAALLDLLAAGLEDDQRWGELYERFWRDLAASSHNQLYAFLSPALRLIVHSAGFFPGVDYRRTVVDLLRRVLAAIASRDVRLAREEMRALEEEYRRRLLTRHPDRATRVVVWADLD